MSIQGIIFSDPFFLSFPISLVLTLVPVVWALSLPLSNGLLSLSVLSAYISVFYFVDWFLSFPSSLSPPSLSLFFSFYNYLRSPIRGIMLESQKEMQKSIHVLALKE